MNLIKKITKENILSFFVIICPILDIASFLFRNRFNTSISISTFIRPIIPVIVFLHIFFKEQNKNKFRKIKKKAFENQRLKMVSVQGFEPWAL